MSDVRAEKRNFFSWRQFSWIVFAEVKKLYRKHFHVDFLRANFYTVIKISTFQPYHWHCNKILLRCAQFIKMTYNENVYCFDIQ